MSQFDLKEEFVPEASETTWFNPTGKAIALKLYVGVERSTKVPGTTKKRSPWVLYVVEPGKERKIPSEFDTAIQDVRGGVVVGGKGVQLVNRSAAEPPTLHESVDPKAVEAKAQAAMIRENEMVQKTAAATVASLLASAGAVAPASPASADKPAPKK